MTDKEKIALYNSVRSVPAEAQKKIEAGRQKGKTSINPMWRIQTLTKKFGPAGVGWYTETKERWTEEHGNEKVMFIKIHLYIKTDENWSAPIEGFGGSMIVTTERNGIFVDDDAAKKAYTDAISQACRSLGIGADVYWETDVDKYIAEKKEEETFEQVMAYMENINSPDELTKFWQTYSPYYQNKKEFKIAFAKKQNALNNGTGKKQ